MSDFHGNQELDALVQKFEREGLLSEKEIALCFELKRIVRAEKNAPEFNAFVLNHGESKDFYKNIETMLESNQAFNFSFAYKSWGDTEFANGHWTSGQIRFNPETNNLKIFLCDPLGEEETRELYECYLLYGGFDFQALAQKHSVEVFLSTDKLQRTLKGCSYFAIDSCFALTNPLENQDIFEQMKAKSEMSKDGEVSVYSGPVPPRLKRQEQSLSTLASALSDEAFASIVVNKKGYDFKRSVGMHTSEMSPAVPKLINARMQNKREKLKEKVTAYLTLDVEGTPSVSELLKKSQENHRLSGLEKYAKRITDFKPSHSSRSRKRPR